MQICWNKNKRVQLPFRICLEHQHGRLDFMWKRPADVGLLILSTTTEVQLQKSPGGTHVYGKRQTSDSSWNSRFVENVNTRQHLQYSLLKFNSRKNCQHLTNWTSWNKCDKVWSSATSLFNWRFRSRRCRRCLSSLFSLDREVAHSGPSPFSIIYQFWLKKYPFHIPSIDKWYSFHIPSLEHCIAFNCCKCTVFKIWINLNTTTFSRPFYSQKMHLLALLGLFTTDRNDRFP